ncbi:MAG: hypothetical protein A3H00_02305 [Candidatus Portnoybacteria bacterium RBG_13_40_8]|nr:MAG: hypothetical protein A3H00_02305 [Candidatus Portnoybacteria bacterium RBG_13_40_8]
MDKTKIIFILPLLFLAMLLNYVNLTASSKDAGLVEGSLVKTAKSPKVYVIIQGKKHWLPTTAVLNSYPGYKGKKIEAVEPAVLDKYPRIKLIKLANNPKVYYLTESGLKRHLQNPEVFLSYNNKWPDIIEVNQIEINSYENNELIRLTGDEKVYKIENSQKRWIKTAEVFKGLGYDWSKIAPINQIEFYAYFTGGPITSAEPEQSKYPNTLILKGPGEATVLENTEITFKYSGVNPLGEVKDLTFETYLKGYDESWQEQDTNDSRTFSLSQEPRGYTFYVRARNQQGWTDPTPASMSFSVGVSPYYGQVKISNVNPNEENFKNDYLILENDSDELINISGWTIRGRKEEMTIPRAINKLSASFSTADYTDIKLSASGRIFVSMGTSPSGINFRLNKCTGYLDPKDEFFPSLDKGCPSIAKSEYSDLKSTCRSYIDQLSQCEIPDYVGNWDISADSDCTAFLNERFNYSYCFSQRGKETDFFKDEWRVFLGRTKDFLDNDSDKIILRDKNGLKVGEYEY